MTYYNNMLEWHIIMTGRGPCPTGRRRSSRRAPRTCRGRAPGRNNDVIIINNNTNDNSNGHDKRNHHNSNNNHNNSNNNNDNTNINNSSNINNNWRGPTGERGREVRLKRSRTTFVGWSNYHFNTLHVEKKC